MIKYLMRLLFFFPVLVLADAADNQRAEIDHLLDFVKNSDCIITRNGTDYSGESAVSHIEKKYDYFRDDIKNTEDFIEYSATRSTLSGRYYTVNCRDKKVLKTKDWLLAELKAYRTVALKEAGVPDVTMCTEPRPQMCTREYRPVCASLKGGATKTMSSGCSACSKADVVSYQGVEC